MAFRPIWPKSQPSSIAAETAECDVALCLPATLIERAVRAAPGFAIGGQDVHQADKGAHTGCISAAMLLDAGARLTIVGHSERREAQGESDADVRAKAEAALAAGLGVILCVGESDAVREAGEAVATVSAQLDASLPGSIADPPRFSVAYEPIWAIGTGKVPSIGRHRRDARRAAPPAEWPPMAKREAMSGSSMAARSRPPTPPRSSPCPMSTARWSAAQA